MHNWALRRPRRAWLAAFGWCLAWTIVGASPASAQQRLDVPLAGRASWAQMLQRERQAPASAPSTTPAPMPAPPPREIGLPPGGRPALRQAGAAEDIAAARLAGGPVCDGLTELLLQENFQALSDNGLSIPPDTHGAAGPNHLMTILNTEVGIQSRDGLQLSQVSLDSFWLTGTGLTGNPFDPKVLYDPLSGRWLATCVSDANSTTSSLFFAISDNDDPTGTWSFYEIDADPADVNWADYPGFGVNGVWIAITNNMFSVGAMPAFDAVRMWVIDKSTALAGGALTITIFSEGFDLVGGFDSFTMQPSQTLDPLEPDLYIASSPGVTSGGIPLLRFSRITGTGAAPTWGVIPGSPFTGAGLFAVPTDFQFGLIDASQAGGSTLVDTGDRRVLNSVFRNGRQWLTHAGGLPATGDVDRTAAFWYEVDPAGGASPIVQSDVIDGGPDTHHFYPSIAVNCNNDMCLGFSRSDSMRFVGAAFAGRLAADVPGTTRPVEVITPGVSFYSKFFSGTRNRWGDYSATVVDPADDMSFWTIQEYAEQNVGGGVDDGRWGTWWARVGSTIACIGDVNGDLQVGVTDLLALLAAWGPCPAPCAPDFNGDLQVGVTDLLTLLAAWGPCPIGNDLLADARFIASGAYTFGNTFANTDGPPDCPGLTNDVWYCYVAPCLGEARISLCGSNFDTVLAVYDGCGSTAVQLACADDECSIQSEAVVAVTLGQQLLIRVGGKNGASGAGTLTVTCESNDFCDMADDIGLGDTAYSTLMATSGGPALPMTCDEGFGLGFAADIWFVHLPAADGTLTVSACNQADYDTRLAAYAGDCNSLVLAACNDDAAGCGLTSELNFAVTTGVPVLIRVGGFDGSDPAGTGTLSLSFVPLNGRAAPGKAGGPARDDARPVKAPAKTMPDGGR